MSDQSPQLPADLSGVRWCAPRTRWVEVARFSSPQQVVASLDDIADIAWTVDKVQLKEHTVGERTLLAAYYPAEDTWFVAEP